MHHLILSLQKRGLIISVYLSHLFLSFHYFTTVYVNSSFLETYLPQHTISGIYVVASALNILIFLYVSTFLRAFGNYKLTLIFAILDLLAVLGLAHTVNLSYILPLFVLHQALVPMVLFNLDIFLEHCTKDENATGEMRGIFLTVANIALVISPLLLTWLNINDFDFSKAYLLSSLFLVPVILIVLISMRHFKDLTYHPFNLKYEFSTFLKNKNLGSVLVANFLLQLFYSFMVIYIPIYLTIIVGFTWQEFTLMLSIALLPFLLFELPAGELADKKWGEKELMITGFVIMGLSVAALSYMHTPNFIAFAIILFLTRTGAALVEVTTESYFFKQTKESDADLMGIFRISRPISFLIGPLLGGLALYLGGYELMFLGLSILMLSGIMFISLIVDTR